MRYRILGLFALALVVMYVFTTGAQQTPSNQTDAIKAAQKELDEQLPIVDFNASKPTEITARLKREAKDRRYNLGNQPITGAGRTSSVKILHWPADFPPIPVVESTTIVIGKISDAQANITEDRSGVYSEATVKVEQVLKDASGMKPGTIVVEREGGRVRLPSGDVFRYWVDGLGFPKVGRCYLLFLKKQEDGDFVILTGYELLNGRVIPLDESEVVPFQKYKNADETTFLTIVRDLIKQS